MKIVVATTTAFHMRHLAVQLLRHGHDVTFISYLPRWKTRLYGLPDRATRSLFWRLQPAATLALWRGGGRRLSALREQLLQSTDEAIAADLPPCDVFIGLSAMAVASARKARDSGAVTVIERGSAHVLAQEALIKHGKGTGLSSFYVGRELASYRAAQKIVVPSRFATHTFLNNGELPERLCEIMLGANLQLFRPIVTPPPLPVKVLYVGQWSYQKGVDLLVEAKKRIPGIHFTHVGLPFGIPFPKDPYFRSIGYLNHAALSREMGNHHLLVLPSRQDGFGMVMTEALAAGLRVVASDATGGPDLAAVLPRHVTVFSAGSAEALVTALQQAIAAIEGDPVGFRPTVEEVEQFSWEHYGHRYDAFLRSIVPGGV